LSHPSSPSDFEAEAGVRVRYTTVNVGSENSARISLSQDAKVIGSFTHTLLSSVRQFDGGPPNLGAGVDLEDRSEDRLHHVERMLTVNRLAPEDSLLK
jgi:hypothetical protein